MSSPTSGKWVRFRCAGYLVGRGLTFGADDILPAAATDVGKWSLNIDLVRTPVMDVMDTSLTPFADGAYDHVFVGRRLESVEDLPTFLKALARKLKVGGHVMFHLPILAEGEYDHHQFTAERFPSLLAEAGRWQAKDSYQQDGYFLQIYKKVDGKRGIIPPKAPSGKPRACVVRYGALGDMVILTPLLRALAEDGYEVTLNITPYAAPVVDHNPFVHNIIFQEREAIPNGDLGEYWNLWKDSYQRYINLSESLEGALLRVEGRKNFYTHQSWRQATGEVNYYDRTMEVGGYPQLVGKRGELFFTSAEERRAKEFFAPLAGRFVILWGLNGSAAHKVYPLFEMAAREWLDGHPDTTIITVGDYAARLLEFEHPQVICKCGEWSLRESMIATKYASLVISPESFIANCAGCFDTPKIVLMSHSGAKALTGTWTNVIALEPDRKVAPCAPCYQLHYTRFSCPLGQMVNEETGEVIAEGPLCTMNAIPIETLLSAVEKIHSSR